MTDSSKSSIFSPLDTSKPQIRLIRIEPGDDEITCTLHLSDLEDDSCHYEASHAMWMNEKELVCNAFACRFWKEDHPPGAVIKHPREERWVREYERS